MFGLKAERLSPSKGASQQAVDTSLDLSRLEEIRLPCNPTGSLASPFLCPAYSPISQMWRTIAKR